MFYKDTYWEGKELLRGCKNILILDFGSMIFEKNKRYVVIKIIKRPLFLMH